MSRGTQGRTMRVDPDLWEAFGEVARQRGTDRAALLREYMRTEVERSKSATGDLLDGIPSRSRG